LLDSRAVGVSLRADGDRPGAAQRGTAVDGAAAGHGLQGHRPRRQPRRGPEALESRRARSVRPSPRSSRLCLYADAPRWDTPQLTVLVPIGVLHAVSRQRGQCAAVARRARPPLADHQHRPGSRLPLPRGAAQCAAEERDHQPVREDHLGMDRPACGLLRWLRRADVSAKRNLRRPR
jgi:hypothetical protein